MRATNRRFRLLPLAQQKQECSGTQPTSSGPCPPASFREMQSPAQISGDALPTQLRSLSLVFLSVIHLKKGEIGLLTWFNVIKTQRGVYRVRKKKKKKRVQCLFQLSKGEVTSIHYLIRPSFISPIVFHFDKVSGLFQITRQL